MLYSEKLKLFTAAHPCEHISVDGAHFRYILSGKESTKTLVFLNGGMILISTGGMDEATLKTLKKKYFLAPLMLWYMKHCNYEKLKPRLIKAGMSHIRNESVEEIAYAEDMFETIFKDYKQEKDVHISSLLADLMNQTPVTADDFAALEGKILLILPNQDFFSGKMQENLKKLMHNPEVSYVSGGHLSTVLKTDDYIKTIREFLSK